MCIKTLINARLKKSSIARITWLKKLIAWQLYCRVMINHCNLMKSKTCCVITCDTDGISTSHESACCLSSTYFIHCSLSCSHSILPLSRPLLWYLPQSRRSFSSAVQNVHLKKRETILRSVDYKFPQLWCITWNLRSNQFMYLRLIQHNQRGCFS